MPPRRRASLSSARRFVSGELPRRCSGGEGVDAAGEGAPVHRMDATCSAMSVVAPSSRAFRHGPISGSGEVSRSTRTIQAAAHLRSLLGYVGSGPPVPAEQLQLRQPLGRQQMNLLEHRGLRHTQLLVTVSPLRVPLQVARQVGPGGGRTSEVSWVRCDRSPRARRCNTCDRWSVTHAYTWRRSAGHRWLCRPLLGSTHGGASVEVAMHGVCTWCHVSWLRV